MPSTKLVGSLTFYIIIIIIIIFDILYILLLLILIPLMVCLFCTFCYVMSISDAFLNETNEGKKENKHIIQIIKVNSLPIYTCALSRCVHNGWPITFEWALVASGDTVLAECIYLWCTTFKVPLSGPSGWGRDGWAAFVTTSHLRVNRLEWLL